MITATCCGLDLDAAIRAGAVPGRQDKGPLACRLALGLDDRTLMYVGTNVDERAEAGPWQSDPCGADTKITEFVIENLRTLTVRRDRQDGVWPRLALTPFSPAGPSTPGSRTSTTRESRTMPDTQRTRHHPAIAPLLAHRDDPQLPPDGQPVDQLIEYLSRRGWTVLDRSADLSTADLYYRESFGAVLDTDDRELTAADHYLTGLDVSIARHGEDWTVIVTPCGTIDGCLQHRSIPVPISTDGKALPEQLDRVEHHARTIDPTEIATCLIFGPCGSNSRSDTQGPPPSPSQDGPPRLYAVAPHGDEVE